MTFWDHFQYSFICFVPPPAPSGYVELFMHLNAA